MDKNDFLIPINGLTNGKSVYSYTVNKEFFESYGNVEIHDAALRITAEVEKSGQYVGIDCHMEGDVTVECDRCLDPLSLPVDVTALLSLKFGGGTEQEEDDSSGREVIRLSSDNAEFDLAQVIYDYVCLSLPQRRYHPEGGCNEKVLEYLRTGISVPGAEEAAQNSPFASLKTFFDN